MNALPCHYKDILIIDIETVTGCDGFENLDERLQTLWGKKARTIKNEPDTLPEELYFQKGAIYSEFGKVVSIAVGVLHQDTDSKALQLRVKDFSGDDEKVVLEQFKELIEKFEASRLRLVAHNGREFDYPYICRRMLLNGINIPAAMDIRDKKPWEILHFDTMEMWKFGDRKHYTSLDLLAAIFDIPTSKSDIDGSQVNEVYYKEKDLERIALYCKRDVVVTAQLFLRLYNHPIISEQNIEVL